MKNRILILSLSLITAFSITACGSGKDSASQSAGDVSVETSSEAEKASDEAPASSEVATESSEEASSEEAEAAMTLEDWINTDEAAATADAVNAQLESSGLKVAFTASGDELCMEYTFLEQVDFGNASAEEISASFEENIAPVLATSAETMAEAFSEQYGIIIEDVRVRIFNADETELFNKTLNEMQ